MLYLTWDNTFEGANNIQLRLVLSVSKIHFVVLPCRMKWKFQFLL